MKRGVIRFPKPQEIPPQLHKPLREMEMKAFGGAAQNFSGLREFGEVE